MPGFSQKPRLRSAGSSHLQFQIHTAISAKINIPDEEHFRDDHFAVKSGSFTRGRAEGQSLRTFNFQICPR
jgi:hypothetical protein